MKNFIVLLFLFSSATLFAQLEPLWEYGRLKENEKNHPYSTYRVKWKKYYFYEDYIVTGKDTIALNKSDDIIFYALYKKRYLFVSHYPKDQKHLAIGFAQRKLSKVDVIDLKKSHDRWSFNFKILEEDSSWRLGLDQINGFDPKTGEIIFDIKFAVSTYSKLRSLPITNKNIPSY
ncbi:hypothetical protein [Flavobacterium subsaxonicum]|uniref:Uncharacterized protein n=1 Tax=Flavobacterium subsaxonicum WB 4.1-42 = DSM 21790 TaxID=1121898 RepID=A0A0A2MHV8_9FLAO|nr:hypothetical protein [Flavobacterium subsaxonicum]KGO92212.1 hypothetical protein Q766_13705 [Flavobacterium subsaxonicum WB 4.1-42 = DSM 21790]